VVHELGIAGDGGIIAVERRLLILAFDASDVAVEVVRFTVHVALVQDAAMRGLAEIDPCWQVSEPVMAEMRRDDPVDEDEWDGKGALTPAGGQRLHEAILNHKPWANCTEPKTGRR
jgi:hypothetical protein